MVQASAWTREAANWSRISNKSGRQWGLIPHWPGPKIRW